jgi:hypothetical protein
VFSFANSSKAAAAYREVWRQLQRKTLE